jgi:hypothetical protein
MPKSRVDDAARSDMGSAEEGRPDHTGPASESKQSLYGLASALTEKNPRNIKAAQRE